MESVKLRNGKEMPLEGFGVFQISDRDVCESCVYKAIESGYRLIDTAAAYYNEEAVGKAVKRAIEDGLVKREDLFITTKLWVSDFSYEGANQGIERSLKKLGLGYIDLILLHQPFGDIYGAWRRMEEAYDAGIVKSIGVSNFNAAKLAEFSELVRIKPMVNQIELHPFYVRQNEIDNMAAYRCIPQAWGPFAEGKFGIFDHPVLTEIGRRFGKTAAQVALRWNVQRGVCVLPKSVNEDRIESNLDIWDFQLTEEEMKRISGLDVGHSEIVDHNDPAFVKFILSLKVE